MMIVDEFCRGLSKCLASVIRAGDSCANAAALSRKQA